MPSLSMSRLPVARTALSPGVHPTPGALPPTARPRPARRVTCGTAAAPPPPRLPTGPAAKPPEPIGGGPAAPLKRALFDTLVKTSLYGTYGTIACVSAALRRIYEKQLIPEGTQVTRNIVYTRADAAHPQTLDIFAPPGTGLPVVVYMHGGAFVHGSKDTHWMMPLPFAHVGCVVVNINYRLAPEHPFPAALEDACGAVGWVLDHIAEHGGDPERMILAGDSAGGNLVTATNACMCWERPEPFARALFERGVTPRAVLPHGATYSMAKFDTFIAETPKEQRIAAVLSHVNNFYLRPPHQREGDVTLASPLTLCDPATPPARPLPPFFISAGTEDPLLEDGLLAAAALRGAGARVETAVYEGGIHVFHALYFAPSRYHKIAVAHWVDTIRFLRGLGLVGRKPTP